MKHCTSCRCETTTLYQETGCVAFRQAVQRAKYPQSVTVFSAAEYSRMKCVLRDDGLADYALTPDAEIVSLFSIGEPGAGRGALADAIKRGGAHLQAFDGFLTHYYRTQGFEEKSRVVFDPGLAPEGWNYEKDGKPDVVFMRYVGHYPQGGSK